MILQLLAFIFVLWGCTTVKTKSNNEEKIQEPIQHTPAPAPVKQIQIQYLKRTPIVWDLADPQCTSEKALDDLGVVRAWIHVDGKAIVQDLNLDGYSGRGGVGGVVSGVFHGLKVQTHHKGCQKLKDNEYSCPSVSPKVLAAARPLTLCQKGPYPRASVENAALVALASISASSRNLANIENAGKLAKKVELIVLPDITTIIETPKEKLLMARTDNAFWSTMSVNHTGDSITILPHSDELLKFFGFQLWENPGVLSHEFGHHLFFNLTPQLYPEQAGENHGFDCDCDALINYVLDRPRQVHKKIAIDAVNEGYADLIAYYTFENRNKKWGALQFGKFIKSRDVTERFNDDGQPKQMTASVLKHFFSLKYSYPDQKLTPNHQDVHTIGAIFAHSYYRFLSLKYARLAEAQRRKAALSALMEWQALAQKNIRLTQQPSDQLRELMHLMLQTTSTSGKIPTAICSEFTETFPEYRDLTKSFTCQI